MLVWFCRFPFPLGVWEGLRFVIVALPGLFSYLFLHIYYCVRNSIIRNGMSFMTPINNREPNQTDKRSLLSYAPSSNCSFMPTMPMIEGGWGGGGSRAYVVSQTILLHMKRLNKTKSSIFVLLFPKSTLAILSYTRTFRSGRSLLLTIVAKCLTKSSSAA